MRAFISTLIHSLLIRAAAAAVLSSQVNVVYNDITTIDKNVKKLTLATASYKGGAVGLVPVNIDFVPVYGATRKGYYDSLLLPSQLSESDAQRLIDHVNQTLSIDNPKAVNVLKSKKLLLQPKGLDPFIKTGLEALLSAHLSFSNEVAKRIPQDQQPQGHEVINVITVALQDGITFFSD